MFFSFIHFKYFFLISIFNEKKGIPLREVDINYGESGKGVRGERRAYWKLFVLCSSAQISRQCLC